MNEVNWMQQGWECPKCGAVMGPHVDCCVNCRGNKGGGTATTITNPIDKNIEWDEQNSLHLTSVSSQLDPPYVLKKQGSHDEWWEKAQLNGYKAESKEDPTVKYSSFQTKSIAVGDPNPVFDAAGGPPELNFDLSGYKEDPEKQWERYQLNV